jgi:ubiquinone/menaquinone biosynthesis C-methylase UbiE
MTVLEATNLIRAGVGNAAGQTWADLGAGDGTFTRALARLVGEQGRVIALDHDDVAIRELRRISRETPAPRLDVIQGDVRKLELPGMQLDGALFANVLHFIEDPAAALARVRTYLRPQARVLVVEYEQRARSRWVPYPLPLHRLAEVASEAGFATPVEVGRRKSRYQGELFCAALASDYTQAVGNAS